MSKVRIAGKVAHMAAADVLGMVDPARLAQIRANDQKPEIRAYTIAHEGEASGTAVGVGSIVMQYFRRAITAIHSALRPGTKVFNGHNADNGHEGRQAVGEVVGKAISDASGLLADIAAVYIYPEYRGETFDMASIEADIEFSYDAEARRGEALSVGEITGIALGDSSKASPGFPGATLLATVQAFAPGEGKGSDTMTAEELKAEIKKGEFRPGDLFDDATILDTQAVQDHVKATVEKETRTAETKAKEIERRLGKKLDEAKERAGELQKQVTHSRIGSMTAELAKERKFTPELQKFVERRLGSVQIPDDVDGEAELKTFLQKHLDAEKSEFDAFRDIMGIKPKEGEGDRPEGGAPSGDGTEKNPEAASIEDLAKPENNDLIPAESEA